MVTWQPHLCELSKYKYSQKSAAEYIKRILEDDEVFKYHTSNFDVDKVFKFTERVCSFGDYVCNFQRGILHKGKNL